MNGEQKEMLQQAIKCLYTALEELEQNRPVLAHIKVEHAKEWLVKIKDAG